MNDSVLIPKERNGSRLSCDFFFFFLGGCILGFSALSPVEGGVFFCLP